MKLPRLVNLVGRDNTAYFTRFEDNTLWYRVVKDENYLPTEDTFTLFEFPVPVSDTAGAVFQRQDKAILFMRWIRKHLDFLKNSQETETNEPAV